MTGAPDFDRDGVIDGTVLLASGLAAMIDWSHCPDVECVPDRMSGAWVVRGTRILAQAVIDNADDGYTPERIAAEIYPSLAVESARRVIAFARRAHAAAASA